MYLQINFPQRILETWHSGLPIAMNCYELTFEMVKPPKSGLPVAMVNILNEMFHQCFVAILNSLARGCPCRVLLRE